MSRKQRRQKMSEKKHGAYSIPVAHFIKHKVCGEVLPMDTGYQFMACSCDPEDGRIFTDGGDPETPGNYCRVGGDPDQIEFFDKDMVLIG